LRCRRETPARPGSGTGTAPPCRAGCGRAYRRERTNGRLDAGRVVGSLAESDRGATARVARGLVRHGSAVAGRSPGGRPGREAQPGGGTTGRAGFPRTGRGERGRGGHTPEWAFSDRLRAGALSRQRLYPVLLAAG